MSGIRVAGVGVLTGWGAGLAALPADARHAAAGREIVSLPRPQLTGDRFRRATRECLLGVAAVDALLAGSTGVTRESIAGPDTAMVYVTAAAYASANRAFIEGIPRSAGTLHFPYTAPSAVPAEVAIEFGLHGAYTILVGGAVTALEALRHAAGLLARGHCARVLVLAVETFEECADLYARARWLVRRPLVEAAVCVLLVPGALAAADMVREAAAGVPQAGEMLACGPLLALALSAHAGIGAGA
jgi:3-oxoacyl-(acyl-carrier-protein) synthase